MIKIKNYLNTSKEEVEAKKHNIWIGISLGNKYFTKENIKEYIEWAIKYTKEDVLVVICDEIHAFNLEVLDDRSKNVALNKALKLGDEKFNEVNKIIKELPKDKRKFVRLVRWGKITEGDYYDRALKLIRDYFHKNSEFHNKIVNIVKEGRKDRASKISKLSEKQLNRLCEYVLHELPHFVNGVQGYGSDKVYTLLPYPGIGSLDHLFIDLQNKKSFPELVKKLKIENRIAILDAYVVSNNK